MSKRRFFIAGLVAVGLVGAPAEAAPQFQLEIIGHLDGSYSSAQAVSNSGVVVGYAGTSAASSLPRSAVAWTDGALAELGTLGGTRSTALGVNDTGAVVGWARDSSEASQAMVYRDGTMTGLNGIAADPQWNLSTAWSVNNAGQVVGVATGPNGDRGFVLSLADGSFTPLGTLGGDRSDAYGLNEAGDVVGRARTAAGETHAFLYRDGTMTDLGTLGGSSSQAWDINNHGVITGWATDATGQRLAFVHDGETMTALASLGDRSDQAYGINDMGWVVGQALDATGASRAVLWVDGEVFDLNTLILGADGWILDFAWGINDRGWIVGNARDAEGNLFGFVLTPIPEPGALPVLIAALGLMLAMTARRRDAVAA